MPISWTAINSLCYSNQHTTKRIIVLGPPPGYQSLSIAEHWASDCTFEYSRRLTERMNTLHLCLPGTNNTSCVVPAIYAILCDK